MLMILEGLQSVGVCYVNISNSKNMLCISLVVKILFMNAQNNTKIAIAISE
jgi:hypothetical protein